MAIIHEDGAYGIDVAKGNEEGAKKAGFFNVDPISIWLANDKALRPDLVPLIRMVGQEYDRARPGTVVARSFVEDQTLESHEQRTLV